jgi:hypothetical protein
MTTDQPTALGSGTITTIERAIADVRHFHPEIPAELVVRTGSGRTGRRGSIALGSVTTGAWVQDRPTSSRAKSDPESYYEFFISGELLGEHPVRLMQTIIHECAHLVADARGIKEVSRQNRYHNRRFRTLCEEMGLSWDHLDYAVHKDEDGREAFTANPDFDPAEPADIRKNPRYLTCEAKADTVIGFSDMTITKDTARKYRDTIAALDKGVSVSLGAPRLASKAPTKRRTVCMFPTRGHAFGLITDMEQVGIAQEDCKIAEDDIQRIGIKVYEGLAARKLLAPHVAWIEEV